MPLMRRAVFVLDEGDVDIGFPAKLSKESVEDLSDYLSILIKRLRQIANHQTDGGGGGGMVGGM